MFFVNFCFEDAKKAPCKEGTEVSLSSKPRNDVVSNPSLLRKIEKALAVASAFLQRSAQTARITGKMQEK
jgi:hypothetical protein